MNNIKKLIFKTSTAEDSSTIVANNDSYSTPVGGGISGSNILDNDTLNGITANTSTVVITQISTTNPNVNVNTSTGEVVVDASVVEGTYYIQYSICEIGNLSNCDSAIVTVTITPEPSFSAWGFSSPGRSSSSTGCANLTFTNTFYSEFQGGVIPALGSIMYLNSSLTTPVGGGDQWFNSREAYLDDNRTVYQISSSGELIDFATCP